MLFYPKKHHHRTVTVLIIMMCLLFRCVFGGDGGLRISKREALDDSLVSFSNFIFTNILYVLLFCLVDYRAEHVLYTRVCSGR